MFVCQYVLFLFLCFIVYICRVFNKKFPAPPLSVSVHPAGEESRPVSGAPVFQPEDQPGAASSPSPPAPQAG